MDSNNKHRRQTDNMEFEHERVSDRILVEIMATIKSNSDKFDRLAADVNEIKTNGDVMRERLVRVEVNQQELKTQLQHTSDYVMQHAKEEELIFRGHVEKMQDFNLELDSIRRGFPKNDDGERDPRSHADGHEIEAAKKKDLEDLAKEIKKWIVMSILAAIATGVGYLLISGSKIELQRLAVEEQKEIKK